MLLAYDLTLHNLRTVFKHFETLAAMAHCYLRARDSWMAASMQRCINEPLVPSSAPSGTPPTVAPGQLVTSFCASCRGTISVVWGHHSSRLHGTPIGRMTCTCTAIAHVSTIGPLTYGGQYFAG